MSPGCTGELEELGCFPRTRGDEPGPSGVQAPLSQFSPHTRG